LYGKSIFSFLRSLHTVSIVMVLAYIPTSNVWRFFFPRILVILLRSPRIPMRPLTQCSCGFSWESRENSVSQSNKEQIKESLEQEVMLVSLPRANVSIPRPWVRKQPEMLMSFTGLDYAWTFSLPLDSLLCQASRRGKKESGMHLLTRVALKPEEALCSTSTFSIYWH
jgi:hypothetical protein